MKNTPKTLEKLPVIKLTLKEYHDIGDGNPSAKVERLLSKIPKGNFRYEITDLKQSKPVVMDLYFILHGGFVKIGKAIRPQKRMRGFQTGAPEKLKILAIIPKMGEIERLCHKKFKHLHVRGEWFKYTDEIDTFIEELKEDTL